MRNNFFETLLNWRYWNFTRLIGLILGLYFLSDFIMTSSTLSLLVSGMVLFQVIMNVGCFAGHCAVPAPQKSESVASETDEDITVTLEDYSEEYSAQVNS